MDERCSVKHDDRAPSCVSCHGVHGIRPAKDPQSKVYAQRVPETCGTCHADPKIMSGFTRADGSPLPTNAACRISYQRAWPCTARARRVWARPRAILVTATTPQARQGSRRSARVAILCHSANASLFDGSKHKHAFEQHKWPECGQCHGNHNIAKTNDPMLATGQGQLCGDCHRQYARDNPDCIKTANYFHNTINPHGSGADKLYCGLSEKLAAKGLDVDPINNELTELGDTLKKSRTYVHSFSRNTFQQVATPGEQAVQRTDALVKKASEEFKYRQFGLAVSIAVIGLLMMGDLSKASPTGEVEKASSALLTWPTFSRKRDRPRSATTAKFARENAIKAWHSTLERISRLGNARPIANRVHYRGGSFSSRVVEYSLSGSNPARLHSAIQLAGFCNIARAILARRSAAVQLFIRGKNKQNPILLFLHGGPGMPTMYLAHDFQHDLERDFVVVQWDRCGAGKSYAAGVSAPNLSVSDEIKDTIELIDQLRARLHQEKIYLVGFSYGTYLGILVAQRAPERLHAYVGVGQLACSEEENRKIQDEWLLTVASKAHDRDAMDELTGKKVFDREKWLFKYGAEIHSAHSWWPLLWSGIRSPEYTFRDIMNVKKGVQFTASHLRYDAINGSILDNVSTIRIPVYFFSGRFDYTDPTICTVALG